MQFDGEGLIPAVIQDAWDGEILMLGYMDREALEATLSTGEVHFHSRSRGVLWRKGETSGNVLRVESVTADCDGDALLVSARPAGPTCHTGERSCFHVRVSGGTPERGLTLATLFATLRQRAAERPAGSYTVKLLDHPDEALKKLLEEAGEVMLAAKNGDHTNLVWEAADVLYHLSVVMTAFDVTPEEVNRELARRASRRPE